IGDKTKKDIMGIFLFALALIGFLSFFDMAGNLGEVINKITKTLFGYGFILFPFTLLILGWKIIKSGEEESASYEKISSIGIALMLTSFVSFAHIFYSTDEMFAVAKEGSGVGGGYLGAIFAWTFVNMVGKPGAAVIISMMFIVSILLAFDISFIDLVSKFLPKKKIKETDSKIEEKAKEAKVEDVGEIKINISGQEKKKEGVLSSLFGKMKKNKKEVKAAARDEAQDEVQDEIEVEANRDFSVKPIDEPKEDGEVKENIADLDKADDDSTPEDEVNEEAIRIKRNLNKQKKIKNWNLPPIGILDGVDGEPTSGDIKANSNIIKRTLANFGIQVEMGEVNVGPTVTQYTLKPSVGIKLSRITALQNDLALALAARSLRIEAPIPGKSLAGIEIPNQTVAMVRLKNILNSKEFYNRKTNLSIVLGRDVSGSPVIANLAKMPHLMVAGSTGSGKTVCINTLITGLLFQNSPENVKFIMVDPKRVELTSYNDIPHLLTPVITDPDKAINALKWAINQMDERYHLLSHIGCRNIESYNTAVTTKYTQRDILPYIIIVIDELADLMATHGREMEAAVVRLAQMARAIGIHLVLSTQRPSVEVITGLIKANITTRIAFQVASQIDSRTILDMGGAEKLLGSGDMLYLSGDSNKPRRIQGVFVSEEEVRKVSDFLKDQNEEKMEYDSEIVEAKKTKLGFDVGEEGEKEDARFEEAVEIVRDAKKASATLLQRRMQVGYSRAARLLDAMQDRGIIG
ncbi:MAG: DNA translocase FtsK 4TM domain-containing protein, partial [Minisyncoccia bacterium]